MAVTATPKKRRSPGQARDATLQAAAELFARRGYQGTSVRDIAAHADVNEALIFRNFGTKAELFEQSIAAPYSAFLHSFVQRWQQLDQPRSNEEMMASFVSELYDFVVEHSDLLFALVVATRFDGITHTAITGDTGLQLAVRELAEQTMAEAEWRNLAHIDLEMAVACTVGLVLAIVLFDETLLPGGREHIDKDRIVREMTAYVIHGTQRPLEVVDADTEGGRGLVL